MNRKPSLGSRRRQKDGSLWLVVRAKSDTINLEMGYIHPDYTFEPISSETPTRLMYSGQAMEPAEKGDLLFVLVGESFGSD